MRVAFIGPFTYFENHFLENWQTNPKVICIPTEWNLPIDQSAYRKFDPEIGVFFRPELYDPKLIKSLPGKKVAFLSEALVKIKWWKLESNTSEKRIRKRALKHYSFTGDGFESVYIYDKTFFAHAQELGVKVSGSQPLPIDTSRFHPTTGVKDIDFLFIGKPTIHRIKFLDNLRWSNHRFLWIAHGSSGTDLSALMQRAKVVLNVHADPDLVSFEPRIDLALASGAVVLSEPVSEYRIKPKGLVEREIFDERALGVALALQNKENSECAWVHSNLLSTDRILKRIIEGNLDESEFFQK